MKDFSYLRELAHKELSECLDKFAGSKVIVWDEALTGPFDLIAKYQFFKERGVIKMFSLTSGRLPSTSAENIIFITRPEISNMDCIAENVKCEEMSGGRNARTDYHILFVPQKSLLCEMRLKDRGVYGSFTYLEELAISWYPHDVDVISLEMRTLFKDYHLDQDPTCLHSVAKAMLTLQAVYGIIPRVFGKGKAAKELFEFMTRLRKEHMAYEPAVKPRIDTLIILDRQVDLISPLMTQLTYEGLIDEFFGINYATVKLPAEKFVSANADDSSASLGDSPPSTKQFILSSREELYSDLRDKNFSAVGPTLGKKARAVSAALEERHGAKTVHDFKLFVDRLPQMQVLKQSLAIHTSIAELVKERTVSSEFLEILQAEQELVNNQNTHKALDFVEDAACQDMDLVRLLRVISLQSVINAGLKSKLLEAYRKLLLQAYGHQHLLSLINLEKAGLLTAQSGSGVASNYSILRKRLFLTHDNINEQDPSDIAYVHSVYAPMSIRLVQHCTSPGWRAIRDLLDLLAGPSFEETQAVCKVDSDIYEDEAGDAQPDSKRTLVLFIGGCTFAEISALRFLSQQDDAACEYLVATTAIITGSKLIETMLTPIEDPILF